MRLRRALAPAVLLAAGWVAPARAHLVETGFGDFYDGIAHVAATPSDLLAVIALALLAGQHGTRASRWTLFALPLAWVVGGALGALRPAELTLPVLTTLTFGLAGALVALKAPLPPLAIGALALLAGAAHGLVNGATMAPTGASALAIAGAGVAAFVLIAIVSAQVVTLRAAWSAIAVRVAGSWIAAAAILMLGWLARPVA
jgi:hydrogenase/urease accessory protein HupE